MPKSKFWNCEGLEEGAQAKVKFTYLDKRVRGEAIRLALWLGGIPFEDERVSYEEVMERRSSLPFSQVPVLDIGNGQGLYAQSKAILRWAGREGGLYPEDSALALRCDGVVDMIEEMRTEMVKAGYRAVMSRHPVTARPMVPLVDSQREEVVAMNKNVVFPTRYKQLESLLAASTGSYFCGESLTIADLAFYVLTSSVLSGAWSRNGPEPSALDECPKLRQLVEHIAALPKVKQWNAQYASEGEP
jgi:glutathione S-transferase